MEIDEREKRIRQYIGSGFYMNTIKPKFVYEIRNSRQIALATAYIKLKQINVIVPEEFNEEEKRRIADEVRVYVLFALKKEGILIEDDMVFINGIKRNQVPKQRDDEER